MVIVVSPSLLLSQLSPAGWRGEVEDEMGMEGLSPVE